MFAILIFSAILASAWSNVLVAPHMDGRIVGGNATTIENVPYQVSLRYENNPFCGGSILTETVVLTAAHCVYDLVASLISVQYGVTVLGGLRNVIAAERMVVNPMFSYVNPSGDVALIFLKAPITMSKSAKPIAIATEAPPPNTVAVVSGWGRVSEGGKSPRSLQRVDVEIVDRTDCEKKYNRMSMDGEEIITREMLCAGVSGGGKDACQGDSGGPLVVNGVQVGVVSWGVGCASPNFPGIYANVAVLSPWIVDNIK